ncbi:hypothetical protein [Actinocrispum sp. NPDC049592]|uniref:hypothetical protein n=1 Tax=Actinocrispum sp. NPDC049592 TaxID=3154835 RepID=UPI00342F06CF
MTEPETISRWTMLAWVTALSGPLAYVLGRVVVETFYGRFDVLPVEVGLRYDSLVAPTLLIMIGTATTGLIVIALGRLAIAIGGVAAVFLIMTFFREGTLFTWRGLGLLTLLLAGVAAFALLGVLEGAVGYRRYLVALIVLLAGTMATLSIMSASSAADDAQAGRPVSLNLLGLPVNAIRATPVRLTGIEAASRPSADTCVLLLGSADGVTVVLDHGVVWRVPADVANTATGCT